MRVRCARAKTEGSGGVGERAKRLVGGRGVASAKIEGARIRGRDL
jgi:hypothetical protein